MSLSMAKTPFFEVPSDPSFVHPPSSFPSLDFFRQQTTYPALIVPAKRTAELRNKLRDLLLHRPKTKSVYALDKDDALPSNDYRKLVLKKDDDIWNDDLLQKLVAEDNDAFHKSSFVLVLDYKDLTVEEALRMLLPVEEIPSAFETVGHIAHINLKDELLPFQHVVGRVILDKNAPRIKTIVNKLGRVETVYRTFEMKVIAGNDQPGWSIVKHLKEEGCRFELDFQHVYWNSRLGGEHRRLVQLIRRSNTNVVVADVMAGIGPFAVPLTTRSTTTTVVHANDLNPASFKYLQINAKHNKCRDLFCYNMDGRAFVHHLQEQGVEFSHAIMNLPATAPEFLDAFRGFQNKVLPQLYVYCFSTTTESKEAIARCETALGCGIANGTVRIVRNVAPKKNMLCVSFVLPEAVRALPKIQPDEPPSKKRKT